MAAKAALFEEERKKLEEADLKAHQQAKEEARQPSFNLEDG